APHVVASRGIRDLDNEQYVWTLEVFRLQRTWVNHHVRLEIGVLAEAECRFGGQFDSVGSRAEPPAQKRRLDDFVVVSFWRHRNQVPPDQFDTLVLLH